MTPPSFDRLVLVLLLGRFIPARAGNTRGWGASWSQPSVHPCAGGEHPWMGRIMVTAVGSSLRGRGTLFLQGIDCTWLIAGWRDRPLPG